MYLFEWEPVIWLAQATYIGGFSSLSCQYVGKKRDAKALFGVPTMWCQTRSKYPVGPEPDLWLPCLRLHFVITTVTPASFINFYSTDMLRAMTPLGVFFIC